MVKPWADLIWDGTFGTGRLRNHQRDDIEVRALVIAPTEMTVGLWDVGKHLVGNGLLKLYFGEWTGYVTEFAGRWVVSMPADGSRMEFNES